MYPQKNTKFIFICGGVLSGLGKGITTASIGFLLKNKGYKVTAVKIDPYISMDAGTMRPQEHGEVFVTADGGEIDMDLGNYERFLHEDFTRDHNITTGKVYSQVIENERKFVYGGRDAQFIPDIPNEVKRRIFEVSVGYDFVMVEIGGTVGDIENIPFLIAARDIGREYKSAYALVSYVPFLKTVGELKTKPTQHAVMLLRKEGINPDFIMTRGEVPLDEPRVESISKRCFLDTDRIIDIPDQSSIYKVPGVIEKQGFIDNILKFFDSKPKITDDKLLKKWNDFVAFELGINAATRKVKIALIGKYVKHGSNDHKDTYISVLEAIKHAGFANKLEPEVDMISAEDITDKNSKEKLEKYHGIVIPQGWGSRGMEGKIEAIKYARENNVPYLGLCYGMQMAVIEYARNVLGLKDANSEEVDPKSKNRVIHLMEEQKKHMKANIYGGTIRLGNWPMKVTPGTRTSNIYDNDGKKEILERHRHRYEYNNEYKKDLEKKGLKVAATSPDGELVEMVEITDHKFFIGTQAHPEYRSRPLQPHPIFVEFIKSC